MVFYPSPNDTLTATAGKRTQFFMSLSNYYDTIDEITNSMSEYLGITDDDLDEDISDFDDDGYIDEPCCTFSDIEMCGNILENFIGNLITLSKDPQDEEILELVEKTVIKLNKLNERCDYELIDTIQGDDICEFLHNAAVEAGLEDHSENVACKWRDF